MPHHLLDLVDPDEEFTRHAVPGGGPRGAGRHRRGGGTTPCWSGAPASTCGPSSTTSTIPGRYPEVAAALEAELDDGPGRAGRPARPPGARSTRSAAARMEPTNRRRVVRALEVTLGSGRPFSDVRPGPRGLPGDRRRPGRARPRRRGDRPAHRSAVRRAWSRPGWSTRCGRWPPGPAGSRARPARRSATGSSWPTSRTGVPLADCRGRGGPADPAVRPAPGVVVPARPPHRLGRPSDDPEAPGRCSETGPRPCTAERTPAARMDAMHATKHHGAGNDFLVVLDPDDADPALGGPGAPAGRPAPGHRRRRRHPGRARAATAATSPWSCATPTAAQAEMSGNGIRCLAQAAVDAGLVGAAALHRGDRRRRPDRRVRAGRAPGLGDGHASTWARPGSGPTSPRSSTTAGPGRSTWATRTSSCSAPTPPASTSPSSGPSSQAAFAGGINVEWITVGARRRRASSSTSGCGSAAWARPWPAGPAAWPRPRRPRELGRRGARRHRAGAQSRAASSRSTLGADERATTYLAGPGAQGGRRRHPPGDAVVSNLLPGTLIERTLPGAHHPRRGRLPRTDRRDGRRGARRAGPAGRHGRRRRRRPGRAAPRPRPTRPPSSGGARPRSSPSCAGASTPTPSSSTTSCRRPSTATSRSSSAAPPSTAPR